MAEHSAIEWTDATWNIITGCSILTPGCTHCYAMRLAGTRLKHHPSRGGLTQETKAGPVWTGEVRVNWGWIDLPLTWARPRNVFVCAHGDLFHHGVSPEIIAQIYGVMISAVHLRGHTFQVLTKRAGRMDALLNDPGFWEQANAHAGALVMERCDPLDRRRGDARATLDEYGPNKPPLGIVHMVSVENQEQAESRIPFLLATPSVARWISAEPLLRPINLRLLQVGGTRVDALTGEVQTRHRYPDNSYGDYQPHGSLGARLDGVIGGGESGPLARPTHPQWHRDLRDQCASTDTLFHLKQLGAWKALENPGDGEWPVDAHSMIRLRPDGTRGPDGWPMQLVGKKFAGRMLDGRTHDDLPLASQEIAA